MTGMAEAGRLLHQYGWRQRYVSEIAGGNSRLDELQAAILRVKLRYLDAENECRRRLAQSYHTVLADTGISLPEARPGAAHVFHQYAICLPQRDALKTYLRQAGVGTSIHYPVPVHLQPAYQNRLPGVASLPWTERVARQVLSLPIYPQMNDDQARRVGECIVRFHSDGLSEA